MCKNRQQGLSAGTHQVGYPEGTFRRQPYLRLGPLGARFASRTTAWLDSENSDPYAGGYSKERAPAHHEKSRSTWLRLPIKTLGEGSNDERVSLRRSPPASPRMPEPNSMML